MYSQVCHKIRHKNKYLDLILEILFAVFLVFVIILEVICLAVYHYSYKHWKSKKQQGNCPICQKLEE